MKPEMFEAYAVGICYASVCTNLSNDEATTRLNQMHPTGLDHGWRVADDPTFSTGERNPSPCDLGSDNRHILFCC